MTHVFAQPFGNQQWVRIEISMAAAQNMYQNCILEYETTDQKTCVALALLFEPHPYGGISDHAFVFCEASLLGLDLAETRGRCNGDCHTQSQIKTSCLRCHFLSTSQPHSLRSWASGKRFGRRSKGTAAGVFCLGRRDMRDVSEFTSCSLSHAADLGADPPAQSSLNLVPVKRKYEENPKS